MHLTPALGGGGSRKRNACHCEDWKGGKSPLKGEAIKGMINVQLSHTGSWEDGWAYLWAKDRKNITLLALK